MDYVQQHKKDKKRMVVLCPKSLMRAAWANDIKKFAPHLRVSLAYAQNRKAAMETDADVYIINVDGVKDLLKYPAGFWKKFGRLVIDESDAYKHATSKRSQAVAKIAKHFEWRRILSGTPTGNGICDLWHQFFILDGGARLGKSFFAFRSACCTPEQTGPSANMLKWTDKPGIELQIAALISDCVIRHKFEDCVDIPKNHMYSVPTVLSTKHRKLYDKLENDALIILEDSSVTAVNKAVLMGKLLQCVSGAIYNDDGGYSLLDTDRYEMTMDMVEARDHSIVFYTWEHQLDELVKLATQRGFSHVVWDSNRPEIEKEFQAGKYKLLLAHPQSAGHGLTLTAGTATIWPSPTYNLVHFRQGLKRIHRIGQKQKTETIVIVAEDTRDEHAWEMLQTKGVRMDALLKEFES
jgi:SNF2 family DNA or RNA helicase